MARRCSYEGCNDKVHGKGSVCGYHHNVNSFGKPYADHLRHGSAAAPECQVCHPAASKKPVAVPAAG